MANKRSDHPERERGVWSPMTDKRERGRTEDTPDESGIERDDMHGKSKPDEGNGESISSASDADRFGSSRGNRGPSYPDADALDRGDSRR